MSIKYEIAAQSRYHNGNLFGLYARFQHVRVESFNLKQKTITPVEMKSYCEVIHFVRQSGAIVIHLIENMER